MIALFIIVTFVAMLLVAYLLHKKILKEEHQLGSPVVLDKQFTLDFQKRLLFGGKRLNYNETGAEYKDHVQDILVSQNGDVYVKKHTPHQRTRWEIFSGKIRMDSINKHEMEEILRNKTAGKVIDYYTDALNGRITVFIKI